MKLTAKQYAGIMPDLMRTGNVGKMQFIDADGLRVSMDSIDYQPIFEQLSQLGDDVKK